MGGITSCHRVKVDDMSQVECQRAERFGSFTNAQSSELCELKKTLADMNKDGFLSPSEFIIIAGPSPFQVEMFRVFDEDQDKKLDFIEFLRSCSRICSATHEALCDFTFEMIDTDQSGTLRLEEIRKCTLKVYGSNVKSAQRKWIGWRQYSQKRGIDPASHVMSIADADRNGVLSAEEFGVHVSKYYPQLLAPSVILKNNLQCRVVGKAFWNSKASTLRCVNLKPCAVVMRDKIAGQRIMSSSQSKQKNKLTNRECSGNEDFKSTFGHLSGSVNKITPADVKDHEVKYESRLTLEGEAGVSFKKAYPPHLRGENAYFLRNQNEGTRRPRLDCTSASDRALAVARIRRDQQFKLPDLKEEAIVVNSESTKQRYHMQQSENGNEESRLHHCRNGYAESQQIRLGAYRLDSDARLKVEVMAEQNEDYQNGNISISSQRQTNLRLPKISRNIDNWGSQGLSEGATDGAYADVQISETFKSEPLMTNKISAIDSRCCKARSDSLLPLRDTLGKRVPDLGISDDRSRPEMRRLVILGPTHTKD